MSSGKRTKAARTQLDQPKALSGFEAISKETISALEEK
jgi:hypothetical protein